MLDAFGYATSNVCDVQIFEGTGFNVAASTNWRQWIKPRGANCVHIFCLGAGAGGGAGLTGSSGAARGGGAGGGSGAIVNWLGSSFLLPDSMYISAAQAGVGGVNAAGGGGVRSYVSMLPGLTSNNLLLASGAADAGGGALGTSTAATAGAASSIATSTSAILSGMGLWSARVGSIGGTGGTGAGTGGAGQSLTALSICGVCGGAGGGGVGTTNTTVNNGGDITGIANMIATVLGGVGNGTNPGAMGWNLMKPFLSVGGSGGGCNGGGTAGKGGAGGWGSGGGGGGGGLTRGDGGDGGPGLVIITSW